MAVEREAKMQVSDHAGVRARLVELGAVPHGRVMETNTFYDTADHRLLAAGRGLRVRREQSLENGQGDVAGRARITYKGGRQPGVLKTREEIEVTVSDADAMEAILEKLGLARAMRFEKRRETWVLDGCEVVLDELPGLGLFVEVEGPTDAAVMATRERLGLSESPLINSSYVAMLAHQPGRREGRAVDVTFE